MKNEILELVNRNHFRNFAVITSGGVRYDITDPNAVAIARDTLHYYFPNSDRVLHLPYDQIATVEELPTSRSKR